jgi:hypothetical protein
MMINVLSLGEAVAGGAPSRSLNDLTCVADVMVWLLVVEWFGSTPSWAELNLKAQDGWMDGWMGDERSHGRG